MKKLEPTRTEELTSNRPKMFRARDRSQNRRKPSPQNGQNKIIAMSEPAADNHLGKHFNALPVDESLDSRFEGESIEQLSAAAREAQHASRGQREPRAARIPPGDLDHLALLARRQSPPFPREQRRRGSRAVVVRFSGAKSKAGDQYGAARHRTRKTG